MRLLAALPLVFLLLSPGCVVEEPGIEVADVPGRIDGPAKGSMSLAAATTGTLTQCSQSMLPSLFPRYCGTETHVLEGVADLPFLPVELELDEGDISIGPSTSGWRLVIHIEAEGASADEVRARLKETSVDWSHERGEGYYLHASVRSPAAEEVRVELKVPPTLNVTGSVRAHGGNAWITEVPCRRLVMEAPFGTATVQSSRGCRHLQITSPDINIRAPVGSLDLSGRDIVLDVLPYLNATWTVYGSRSIDVELPNATRYGYNLSVFAPRKDVRIHLQDGRRSESDVFASFVTNQFYEREVRTVAELSSPRGKVNVRHTF